MDTIDITTTVLRHLRDDIAKLDNKVSVLDNKVGVLDSKVGVLDSKVSVLDSKVSVLETRVTAHDARFDQIDARFAQVDARLDRIEILSFEMRGEMRGGFQRLDDRIDRLHSHLAETTARLTAQHEDLQASLHQMMAFMGQHGSLASRIDACERDILDLKERAF